MADDTQSYLHMDDQWMWRSYFLDRLGKLIVTSAVAYFTRLEAETAMSLFVQELRVISA